MRIINPEEFKIWYVMSYYDLPLSGICRLDGEVLFFEISDDYIDNVSFLEYRLYRFPEEKGNYFIWRKEQFEKHVGKHWTYDDDGKRTDAKCLASEDEFEDFYSIEDKYDFMEVVKESELVAICRIPSVLELDDDLD